MFFDIISTLEIHSTDYSSIVIFHVEKTFNAMVCQMCVEYDKTKSEITEYYKKEQMIVFILSHIFWDF